MKTPLVNGHKSGAASDLEVPTRSFCTGILPQIYGFFNGTIAPF
jgi:hypothetical protein